MNTEALTDRYQCSGRFATSTVLLMMAILFVLCLNTEADAGKRLPIMVITVDVESTYQNDQPLTLPEQVEAVCLGKIPCGLREMVNILKKKGWGATFFLNVFEYTEHGEAFFEKTGKWLRDSGQDVQLHTHPQWRFDRRRNMMYQYTLEEQVKIIKEGKGLLEKWTGAPVIAHRAGSYGADENTLKALVANSILIDSSLFYGWPDSRINSLDLRKIGLSLYGPLYEFPVTVYRKNEHLSFTGAYMRPQSTIRKYDINWFGNEEEAEKAIHEAIQLNMDFIILFLHSYSFIKGRDGAGQMLADEDAIKRFEKTLEFTRMQGMEVRTFGQIAGKQADLGQFLNRQDVIPEISLHIPLIHYIRKVAGINKHNYKGVVLFCGLFLATIGASLPIVRWSMTRSAMKKRR